MRGRLRFVVVVLGFAAAARAQDAPDPHAIADRVVAAVNAGDPLAELAAAADPWLVADVLCVRGHEEAARALARAAKGPDTARLPTYLENRKDDDSVRRVAAEYGKARTREELAAAAARLAKARTAGDAFIRAQTHSALGECLLRLDRHAEAARALLAAGRLAREAGWLAGAATAYGLARDAAGRAANFDAMRDAFLGGHDVALARDDRRRAAIMLANAGNACGEIGDYNQALEYFRRAQRMFSDLGRTPDEAMVLASIGQIHQRRGELGTALAAYEHALKRCGDGPLRGRVLLDVADTHELLGDPEQALVLDREALAILERAQDHGGIARCRGSIGLRHLTLKRYAEARAHLEAAIPMFRRIRDVRFEAIALSNLATVHLETGDLAKARAAQADAVARARSVGGRWVELDAILTGGLIELRDGKLGAAEKAFAAGREMARDLASAERLVQAHLGLARVHMARGRHDAALDDALRAIGRISATVSGLGAGLGWRARERHAELFRVAMAAAARVGNAEKLCLVLESSRAGALLESFDARDAMRSALVPADLREAEAKSRADEAAARARHRVAIGTGDLARIKRQREELDAASEKLEAVVAAVQRSSRRAASALYPRPAPLAQIQGWLRRTDALVLYGEGVALVVTTGDVRVVALDDADNLAAACSGLAWSRKEEPRQALDEIRRLAVTPLRLPATVTRVLISPAGGLYRVPFRLLMGDREVAYVPSGTTYGVLRDSGTVPGRGILGVGAPHYGERALPPLPESEKEVRQIADTVLVGADASEARVRRELASRTRWRSLHLACHGRLDVARPLRSGLELAAAEGEDGLWTALEILSARVPTDLAVLSACDTGRGKLFRGEGIVGLTRAFLVAGVPRVVVSLWKVDDEATRVLMDKFYELWHDDGQSAAAALKGAQAHVRAQAKWAPAYFWAAWQLWGLPH